MQTRNFAYPLALIFSLLLFGQCSQDKITPDITNQQVDIKIRRFEQALFALDTASTDIPFSNQVARLEREYPNFWPVFKQLIGNPMFPEADFSKQVYDFITHPGVRKLYDTTQLLYGNIEAIETDLEKAFGYYKHYFPERDVPEVMSYVSEFGTGVFTYGDSLVGIGWDFFLGKEFPYDYTVFPAYLQRTMDKEHLVMKTIEAVASNMVGAKDKGQRLLDFMIDNGKILYIKSLLLPETPDEVLLEWTTEQLAWMENDYNERELWKQILTRKLIYSTRQSEYQKLITASPSGMPWMPPEAPSKTANWIGWQIVKAYMERHPELPVEDLLAIEDAQKILDGSKYRPSR